MIRNLYINRWIPPFASAVRLVFVSFAFFESNVLQHKADLSSFIKIEHSDLSPPRDINQAYYFVVLLDGEVSFSVDFNDYTCVGKNILFLSPYQLLTWGWNDLKHLYLLRFHGDFYCIEYHKAEVACNGILFNNIYERPFIPVSEVFFDGIVRIFNQIREIEQSTKDYDVSVARSYLQLVLALSSKEKQIENQDKLVSPVEKEDILNFKALLDRYWSEKKSVQFYADQCNLSVNVFSKKVKKYFGKTPSKLIRERLALEAKKLLHLTHKSVKEVAHELGFEDAYYFSRYFKKEVGVSPNVFRHKVGISIVAKSSMQ